MAQVVGSYIQNKIAAEVNKAGAFSLLADEASDSSNKEQLPLVVRFVDMRTMSGKNSSVNTVSPVKL